MDQPTTSNFIFIWFFGDCLFWSLETANLIPGAFNVDVGRR